MLMFEKVNPAHPDKVADRIAGAIVDIAYETQIDPKIAVCRTGERGGEEKMNNKLTMGSLFDGSGGFPLGGLLSGITPVWASEIEPFPIMMRQGF